MSTGVANSVIEIAQSAKAASRLLSTLPAAAKEFSLPMPLTLPQPSCLFVRENYRGLSFSACCSPKTSFAS